MLPKAGIHRCRFAVIVALAASAALGTAPWEDALAQQVTPPAAPVVTPQTDNPNGTVTNGTFSITPRFEYDFADANGEFNTVLHDQQAAMTTSTLAIPFFGLAAQYTPAGSNTDFLFYGSYGETHGTTHVVATAPTPFGLAGFVGNGTVSVNELQFEASARYRIPDLPVYLLAGTRYTRSDADTSVPGAIFADTGTSRLNARLEQYIGEFGAGVTGPLNRAGHLMIFGNVELGPQWSRVYILNRLGGQLARSYVGPGFDISAGINYIVNDRFNAALRYRILIDYISSAPDFLIVQGPEASVTYRF